MVYNQTECDSWRKDFQIKKNIDNFFNPESTQNFFFKNIFSKFELQKSVCSCEYSLYTGIYSNYVLNSKSKIILNDTCKLVIAASLICLASPTFTTIWYPLADATPSKAKIT